MYISKNVKVLLNEQSLGKSDLVYSSYFTDEETEAQIEEKVDAGQDVQCSLQVHFPQHPPLEAYVGQPPWSPNGWGLTRSEPLFPLFPEGQALLLFIPPDTHFSLCRMCVFLLWIQNKKVKSFFGALGPSLLPGCFRKSKLFLPTQWEQCVEAGLTGYFKSRWQAPSKLRDRLFIACNLLPYPRYQELRFGQQSLKGPHNCLHVSLGFRHSLSVSKSSIATYMKL